MSRHPAATRSDEIALHFLEVGADLITAYFQESPVAREESARLYSFKFPAAFSWIRRQDVLRIAQSRYQEGFSEKALVNRWKHMDDYIVDVVAFIMLRDEPNFVPHEHADTIARIPADSAAAGFIQVANMVIDDLVPFPRTYLLLHIIPLLPQHPELHARVLPIIRERIQVFASGYEALITNLGLVPRPEWSIERISLALQAMLDGFCLRPRVMPEEYNARWQGATMFADTVIAFTLGVIDWDKSSESGREALNRLIAKPQAEE